MSAGSYNSKRHTWESISAYVREFQRANGLEADGYAGPLTEAKLAELEATRSHIAKSWPLPLLADGRRPIATNLYKPGHWGWDLFYRYMSGDSPPDDDHVIVEGGLPRWWYPEGTTAIACADGVVVVAEEMVTGHWVWLRHDDGYATGYFHGRDLLVGVGEVVERGRPLLHCGWDTRESTWDKVHLHWEVRRPNASDDPRVWEHVDPAHWLKGATYL